MKHEQTDDQQRRAEAEQDLRQRRGALRRRLRVDLDALARSAATRAGCRSRTPGPASRTASSASSCCAGRVATFVLKVPWTESPFVVIEATLPASTSLEEVRAERDRHARLRRGLVEDAPRARVDREQRHARTRGTRACGAAAAALVGGVPRPSGAGATCQPRLSRGSGACGADGRCASAPCAGAAAPSSCRRAACVGCAPSSAISSTSSVAPSAPPRSPSAATWTAGGRASLKRCGMHRVDDPHAVGLAEAHAQAAADHDGLDVEQVDGRGDARAERAHGAVDQARRDLVAVLERALPDAARQAVAVVLGGQLEELRLGAVVVQAARVGLHRRAAGVGLEAAAAPARAAPAALRGSPCGRSRRRRRARARACRRGSARRRCPCPRRRRAASGRACRRRARTRRWWRRRRRCRARSCVPSADCSAAREREAGASQPGRLSACATVPASESIVPGEPTPTPRSCAGSSVGGLRGLGQRRRHRVGDVGRAAARSASGGGRCRARGASASVTIASIFVPPRSMPPTAARRRCVAWRSVGLR